jgi:hypothetical protein
MIGVMEWRDVVGYEGLYKVSDKGDVWSVERVDKMGRPSGGRMLKPQKHPKGYLFVNLWKEGDFKSILIHRLIAETFIPNMGNKPEVNHIDSNKKNNSVENLEWSSRSENCQHSHDNGNGPLNGTQKKVVITNNSTDEISTFISTSKASKFLGFNRKWIEGKLKYTESPFVHQHYTVEVI